MPTVCVKRFQKCGFMTSTPAPTQHHRNKVFVIASPYPYIVFTPNGASVVAWSQQQEP